MLNLGNIDQNQILQYVDIAFWVLLGLMFGGMLLAFLRGLIRGWKHGTFRTVFLTAMAVVLLLLMPIWIDIIGQFPVNSFYGGPIHMEIQGSAVDVPVTTTFNTAFEFIRTVLVDVFHVRASTESIIAYSIALAGSFIRLLIVFLVAFLTSTVGSFLSWVLWHLIFKRFTPKAKRKPKARIISGLEEAVVWFGLLALMVIPFSGLANAIRNNIEIPEDETNDTLKLVNRVLDSYDQSVFNKVFFEWTKGSGNKTLDTQLAEFFAQNSFTSSAGYTAEANIIKEFSVIASVEGTLGRWMFSEDPSQSTGSALIHTSLLMGNTLYEWARSSEANELLHGLVPLTLDVASNIDEIEKENPGDVDAWLGLDGEDGHPTRLMRAYNRVAESDYVSTLEDVFQGDYAVPIYDSSCSYSDSYLALVREEIESSPRRRQMVNAVISGYVLGQMESNPSWQKPRGSLPSLASAFASTDIESIDWWKEANLFHDVETRLEDLEPEYADSANSSQDLAKELTDSFMSALSRDPNRLIEVLIGKRTPEGEPVTDGKGNNQEFLCLLDSDLIATILPIALEVGAEYVDQKVLTDEADQKVHEDLSTIAVEFQGNRTSETRINFKREFGAILDVPGKIASSDAGKAFIKDYASHPGVDFAENGTIINIDKSIAEAIKPGVESIDKSRVMNAIGAPVADHFVRPLLDPNEGALGKLGITEIALYEDHEGKRINIGKELSSLLDIGVYCNDVVPVIGAMVASDSETSMPVETLLESLAKLEDEDSHYQLTHMLDIICKSKIFNPIVKEGDKVVYNTNVSGILDYLLSSLPGETAINIDTADLEGMDLTSSWDGENIGSTRGENFYLMNCVKTIIDSGLVSKVGDFSGANPTKIMTTLASIPVDDVFASVGQSKILRKSAASIFDNMILKAIFGEDGFQDAVDIGVTYKNLVTPEDWTNEGVAIQSIIDLAYRGLDISQLDPFNPAVVDMLAKLSKSGMFFSAFDEEGTLRDEKEYVFPRFLQDKLLLNLNSKDMMNLFVDYPHKVVDGKSIQDILDETSDWNEKLEQKEKICTVFCSSIASLTTPEEWDTEFGLLKDILQCLNAAGGMEAMNNFDMDKLPALTGAIGYLNHSKVFGPVLLSNAIHMALNSGELPEEIADAEINEGYLYHNAELIVAAREEGKDTTSLENARNTEIRSILRLMDVAAADSDLDINIATLEVEGMLHPMLETLSTSKLFNPTHVSEMYPGEALPEITAFENVVCTIMTKAKLYTDHDGNEITTNDVKVKGSEKTIKDIVLGVSDWDTEIVSICDLIITLQNSSFINDAGELDFSAMTDLDSYFAKSGAHQELQFMLNSLMDSETFYRCLPPKLEESVHDGLSNITMNNLADDLWCADFLYTRNSDGTDFDPYDAEEVERFITVLDHLAPCMKMDTSDLNSVDVDSLSLALEAMGGSMIFNSNTELSSTVAWHDYLPGDPDYRGGKTCFQLFAADMTSVEALEDYFYNASSPKDVAFATSYTSAKQKEVYVLASLLPAYDGSNLGAVEAAVSQYLSQEWGDCVRTLQSSTFDAFFSASSPSIADLSEDALANMLHCLNDCTIYRDCVPNALQKTIVQGDSIQQVKDAGVDLENADFYFSYYYHDGHGNFAAPSAYSWAHPDFSMPFYAPEIDQISMLYSLLLDDSSMIDDPSFDTINPLVLRSLLHDVHDSYALHDSSRLVPADDLTVFEQFMKAFLLKSGVYSDSLEGAGEDETKIIKGTAMTVKKMIGNVNPSHWVDEIENLYELIVHMQESDSFTDSEGSLDLSAISDLDTFFPSGTPEKDATRAQNKHNLAELIRYVEKGEILYRLLPARLEKALKDSLNTSNDLMSKIRADLGCADYYFSQFGSGESLDFKPYSYFAGDESEVDSLVNLFEDISFLQQIDLTDLDTIETDRLVSAMTNMGINRIFNSNITKSETVFAGTTRAGLTAHQAVLCDAVYFDVVSDYYFQPASPKDAYHATEHDYGEKVTYADNVYDKIGYTIGTTIGTLNAYTDVESESALISATHAYMDATETPYQEWATCIEDMKAPQYRRFVKQLDDIEDITEKSTMTGILNALNDCSFYTDAVSNALYRALYLERPFTVNGIDFDSSDVYFSYRYDFDTNGEILGTRGAVTPARLANHFYRTEIDTIVDIYFGFKDNEARFSTIDLGDELLPVKLNEILTDMSQSYIFHVSIKEGGRRPLNTITGVDDTFQDLSVFEQMIYKFVHDTTLDNSSYLPLRDYRYEFASDGSKTPFGAQHKLHDRILAYSESSDWALEINALTTDGLHHDGDDADPVVGIIDAGQKAKIFASGSGDVSVDYESLKKVAPAKIKSLLYAINFSSLLEDVLPVSVADLMGDDGSNGMGLNKFTTLTHEDTTLVGENDIVVSPSATPWIYVQGSGAFHGLVSITVPVASNPTDHFHVLLSDTEAGALVVRDINKIVSMTYSAGKATFGVKGLPKEFTIRLDAGYEIAGDVVYSYDLSNYNIGQQGYRERGIRGMGYLLSSAYRGVSYASTGAYFSFKDSGDDSLQSFLSDHDAGHSDFQHSTYGLLSLFGSSGFYSDLLDETGAFIADSSASPKYYSAGGYAFYKALNFEVKESVSIHIDLGTPIDIAPSATISIGKYIGSGDTDADHLHAITEFFDSYSLVDYGSYVREAAWFDRYATDVGTLDVYNNFVSTFATATSLPNPNPALPDVVIPSPLVNKQLTATTDQTFSGNEAAIDSMERAMGSLVYNYAIAVPQDDDPLSGSPLIDSYSSAPGGEVSDFGREILLGLAGGLSDGKSKTVGINAPTYSPTALAGYAYDRIDSYDVLDDLSVYRIAATDDETAIAAKNAGFNSYLHNASKFFSIMETLYKATLGTDEHDLLRNAFNELGEDTTKISGLFYLASIYDRMVNKGIYNATNDFPSLLTSGVVGGVDTYAFSYSNIALTIPNP